MKLTQKFISVVGTAALGLGMMVGVAGAQETTSAPLPVSVEVQCSMPNTVTLSGGGAFDPYDIATGNGTTYTQNAIGLTVDVGCYFGGWHVNAQVTAFDGPGFAFIPGSLFAMNAIPGSVVSPWPLGPNPVAESQDFTLAPGWGGESEDAIFETYNLFTLPWWLGGAEIDAPAPFVSSAAYDGELSHLDTIFLIEGDYNADLTVELYLDN